MLNHPNVCKLCTFRLDCITENECQFHPVAHFKLRHPFDFMVFDDGTVDISYYFTEKTEWSRLDYHKNERIGMCDGCAYEDFIFDYPFPV